MRYHVGRVDDPIPSQTPAALPILEDPSPAGRLMNAAALATALLLAAVLGARLATQLPGVGWWVPAALVAGMAAADLLSGIVHWAADTWGRDDLPVIGRRLLVPFRVHHINPDDFLRRRFVDVNGDVARLAVPAFLGLLLVPLDTSAGRVVAAFGLAFCGTGMMTNQIHQWAHRPKPPRPVRLLQACGVLLDGPTHAAHHAGPYDTHYCITTGWWNRPLETLGFFRALERLITMATGAQPRRDDRRYETRYGAARLSPR